MTYIQKLTESAGLVSGMAERLDLGFGPRMEGDAMRAGRAYREMVLRCARCPEHTACARLQDDNPALDAAPDYCMNKHSFSMP